MPLRTCCAVVICVASLSSVVSAVGPGGDVPFVRGDTDADGSLGLSDAIRLLNHLFPPMMPPTPDFGFISCLDTGDMNDDESLSIADAINLLGFVFASGAPPAAPYPGCGTDPTDPNTLSCDSYEPCVGVGDADLAGHLLRRIAYGVTPDELERVTQLGPFLYIEEQLEPQLIDESGNTQLNTLLAMLDPDTSTNDLYELQFARAIYSQRQLQEVLTNFWENHLNTYLFKVRSYFRNLPIYTSSESLQLATFLEHVENENLRANALGSFQDLVEISATSVTMLIYLDNVSNFAIDPNENYARELLELHTMGVDNGYTQTDVEQVARCFTGWTVGFVAPGDEDDPHAPLLPVADDVDGVWAFHFDPANHDYDAKTIFENTSYELTIPARPAASTDGILDGFEVIAHLAGLGQTAEFVSTKLVQRLVSDNAPPALVAACISTWLTTDGDMREVVATILHSDEFQDPANHWNKVRTPQESIFATMRAFEGVTNNLNPIRNAISGLRHLPFTWGTPDGFPESGADQLGTSKLLDRVKFNRLTDEGGAGNPDPDFDLLAILNDAGVPSEDEEAIVDFFLALLYQSNVTDTDRDLAIEFLSTDDDGVVVPLDDSDPGYEQRIAHFAAFVISFPQGMKQ